MKVLSDNFDKMNGEATLIERQSNNGQSGVEQLSEP